MWSTFVVILIILVALVALAGVGLLLLLAYLYWWQIARAQPQLEGTLKTGILEAPVEVLRDKHGISHIYATSRADLFRAQGLIHAQDRFWQMERLRRTASGRLAELFGAPALDADRFTRTVGIRRAAEAELATLDDDTRAILTWYAEGVNAWMSARNGRIAAELNLLRVRPEPWTPLDTLSILKLHAWSQSANWESELTRLRLLLQGAPYRAAELEPDTPTANPLIVEADGAEHARLLHSAGLLLNFMESLKPHLPLPNPESAGQGSNAWVVAPKLSMTRKPLLANDPHMAAQIPGPWYENHLVAGDFAVTGGSFAGCPGVILGHNEEIAWGITNAYVDQQDLFIERPHPEDGDDPATPRFAIEDEWLPATVLQETIQVRSAPQPHVERIVISRHGPIVTNLLPRDLRRSALPIALQWSGAEPTGSLVRAFLNLNRATTIEEAQTALADIDTPTQNVVIADQRGNIAWTLAGRIPRRSDGAGILPALGWQRAADWQGYLPAAESPSLANPATGYIVTANNKPVGDDYPHFLGMEFDPGWRAARLVELLGERERYGVRDMEEMQLDTLDKYAAELVRWITLINTDDPWEKVSIQALRKWNFRMEVESVPALVYQYVLIEMLAMMYGDKLGASGSAYIGNSLSPIAPFSTHTDKAQQHLLALLNNEERSFWYHDATTGEQRTRAEFVDAAFRRAVRRIRDNLGDSTLKWQWGRSHQVQYAHPLGSARFLRGIFNRGPIPVGGDQNTPFQTRISPMQPLGMVQIIPSLRQIIEVGNWDAMQSVNATGQSGHPLHAHYDNQIVMWREGVYHLNPWTRPAVEKAAVDALTLT